jgi:2-amino-4-hydroxy-6-hydroxymethyldihydropteridine diphosphokinase
MADPAAADAGRDAFVGLGSNLGDRVAELDAALAALAALPATTLVARSLYYESAPLDASGGDYLNAVAQLRTSLAPRELLRALQAIEARQGRVRPFANAPRTVDLDLLLYADITMETTTLTLPHPRLHERAFVLVPLAEIAPALVIPTHGAVADLIGGVMSQRIAKLKQ